MRSTLRPTRPLRRLAPAAVLLVALLVTGCDAAPGPTTTGGASIRPASPTGTPSAGPASPSAPTAPTAVPSATPAPTQAPDAMDALTRGALAVTVTEDLRVRSQPRVAADSVKHTPTLPVGTQLVVIGGPVAASGYTWIQVSPIGFELRGNVDAGWVAVADHDGTAWVAPATDPTPGYELASVRVERPDAGAAEAKAAAAAQNAFGVALYRRLLKEPSLALAGKGVAMSPYSVATALAMVRAGARGVTAAELDRVLRVRGWDALAGGLNSLDQRLTSRDAAWVDYEDDPHWLALRTANMAFGQEGFPIEPAYLERIARTLGAGLGTVDFEGRPDAAREAINAWVARQTLGRIPRLLEELDVRESTRLVLVNAIYLKAEWVRPFLPENTRDRAFTTAAGAVVTVSTMTQFGGQDIVLASGDGWRATELRYLGMDGTTPLAMTLIVPNDMAAFERRLSTALLGRVQARITAEGKRQQKAEFPADEQDACGWYPYQVRLFLPRFGVDTRARLIEPLKAMGMPSAFDASTADFTGINPDAMLYIGGVIHQANIDVDEEGTTASAATAIGVDTGGCTGPSPRTTKVLRFDKPFVYLVRDVGTGAILFMGRVMDPTKR